MYERNMDDVLRNAIKIIQHTVFTLAMVLALLLSQDVNAGRDEAAAAYDRGDYATAFKELKRLADKGDIEARTMVGFMFANGLGVRRNYAQALEWYRRAADQG